MNQLSVCGFQFSVNTRGEGGGRGAKEMPGLNLVLKRRNIITQGKTVNPDGLDRFARGAHIELE
jgi:hypothetical protein